MSVEHCNGKYNIVLAFSALALAACSASASPTSTAQAVVPAAAAAAVTTAPLVTGLPDFTRLVETYGPAVVNVQVTEENKRDARSELFRGFPGFGDDPRSPRGQQEQRGEGSGFIVSKDGYILTNRHVVADATEVTVRLIDRREFKAKVIGMDENTDVAVIKIDGHDLPTVKIGDPSQLKPGQWVVAIGSPFGMANSVTAGIVSATLRELPQEQWVPFIQTDVAVNPGNSGGPLFNLNGEVVGINSQIFSQSGGYMGLSFAIPIDMADNVRQQLVSTGKVARGYLGVAYDDINAAGAESWGLDRPRGALVTDVVAGEAAEKAGIKPGDVILSVAGRPVESKVMLPAMLAPLKPGTSAELEVWTDRKLRKVTVKVGERKPEATAQVIPTGGRGRNERGGNAEPEVTQLLGLEVRPLTTEEKRQYETSGALVVDGVTGTSARKSGIEPGDIILGVHGTPVRNMNELKSAVSRAAGKVVSLRVERPKQGIQFLEIDRE